MPYFEFHPKYIFLSDLKENMPLRRPVYSRPTTRRSYAKRPVAYSGRGAYRPVYAKQAYRRPARYISGRGSYYIRGKAYAEGKVPGLGKIGGALEGGYVKGLGAYDASTIKHNVLIKPMIPAVMNSKSREGATIIRHREFLGNVTSSSVAGQFKLERYVINPGDSTTFPWLSTIAQNYEEYEMNGLMFQFRSTASDAIASSSNLALGNLMMATQYDSTDPPFLNSTELLNYTWSASAKVSETTTHFIECAPKQSVLSRLYVREFSDTTNPTEDARFSDLGVFSIATEGLQGTDVQVGQLWVSYECLFYKPKMGSLSAEAGSFFNYTCENAGGSGGSTKYFGDINGNGLFNSHNNLGITLANDPANNRSTITFPVAQSVKSYLVVIYFHGADIANLGAITLVNAINCTAVDIWRSGLANGALVPDAVVASGLGSQMSAWVISTDGLTSVPMIHISTVSGIVPTNNYYCDIMITQVPYISPYSPL